MLDVHSLASYIALSMLFSIAMFVSGTLKDPVCRIKPEAYIRLRMLSFELRSLHKRQEKIKGGRISVITLSFPIILHPSLFLSSGKHCPTRVGQLFDECKTAV